MMKSRMLVFTIIAMFLMGMMLSFSHAETVANTQESTPAASAAAPAATPSAPTAAAPATAAPEAAASATATPADTAAAAAEKSLVERAQEVIPEGKKLVARVVWVKGEFKASMPGGTEARTLKMAGNIYMNDTLITDAKSEAQIIFTDNSTMTFRPETKLYINEYNYVPKASKDKTATKSTGKYIMDLVTGGFRTITGMVAKENPNDYQVNTPVATIGVRGTEYSIVYKQGQDLYIKRYTGEPCMTNSASKGAVTPKAANAGGGAAGQGAGSNEVCLDEAKQYGYVADANTNPVAIIEQPSVFRTDVEIVPVSFSEAPGAGAAGSANPKAGNANEPGGGSSSGFCIQ